MGGNVVKLPNVCSVRLDKDLVNSTDFVAILADKQGSPSIYYQTDALTLGMALKLVAATFSESLDECSVEDRAEVLSILGMGDDQ